MGRTMEEIVRTYIEGWRAHDRECVGAVLTETCLIVESDGTEYHGRAAILRWMDDWIASGSIVEGWTISRIVSDTKCAAVEWQFACLCRGNRTSFPGASLFQVEQGRISSITEYRREGRPN